MRTQARGAVQWRSMATTRNPNTSTAAQVAQDAAAERRDETDERDAEQVEPLRNTGRGAGRREDRDPDQVGPEQADVTRGQCCIDS